MKPENLPEQDPLESLLDAEADSDFGLPHFREHLSHENRSIVLKEWTAKDFSDIYVRFQPHLLRHARRYLTNHAQAEEVVQDAFLYLMTSLPEIDSEIGALKLLKWKVRLLALDVIGSNARASYTPLDETFDLESSEEDIDQNLVRADEAAIVSLALAKLQPRQREALIASIYEEKPTKTVAMQLGMNENATRQLLFRAKEAFRKALIGEAETVGLSVAQILSVAARKASQEAGRYITAASVLLVTLAISVGVLPNLATGPSVDLSAPVLSADPEIVDESSTTSKTNQAPAGGIEQTPQKVQAHNAPASSLQQNPDYDGSKFSAQTVAQMEEFDTSDVSLDVSQLASEIDLSPFDPWLADQLFESSATLSLLPGPANELLTAVSGDVWADFRVDSSSTIPISDVSVGFMVDDSQYHSKPYVTDILVSSNLNDTDTYLFIGRIDSITDVQGRSYSQTRFTEKLVKLSVILDSNTQKLIHTEVSFG